MSRIENLKLSEICVSLQSDDKKKRLQVLEKLRDIISDDAEQWSKREILEIWQIMNKHMVKILTDPAESCRDLAIEIIKIFINLLPIIEKNIVYIIPIFVRRLGSQELLEPSEEVRLNCVNLLRLIISFYKDHLSVYIDDFITILSKTVTDNYPKVKRESCEAISELAKTIPVQFYSKSEILIKPILSNFTHQHYRVRVSSVKAIGDVVQYGNNKSIEEVSTPLAERLFDQSGAVRTAVIEVAGYWLLNLRDRYSWWYRLIPLLVTGLHDEIMEIRLKAHELWDATGCLFLQENDSDEKIKDKMDFLTENLDHYPPNIKRPNLGCRLIVQRNIGKLVGGIVRELGDWKADIRVRSAQLLAVLTLNAEEDITQHIEKLLPGMYRACNDQDLRVVDNVIIAAEYMGYFVPPETYCRLVLPTLEDGNITAGHLAVLAAFLRCTERQSLISKLEDIGSFLKLSHICRGKKTDYQKQILRCCQAIMSVSKEDCNVISNDLFTIIFTVWSMSQQEDNKIFAKQLMENLIVITMSENFEDLFENNLREILIDIKNTSKSWTMYSPEVYIFKLCLTEAKSATAQNMDIVFPILKDIMNNDSDAELRLKLFIILSDFFKNRNKTLKLIKNSTEFIIDFFDNILMPKLIWSAGRVSETLRTAAVGCLCALFDDSTSIDSNKLKSRFSDMENDSSDFIFNDKKLIPILEKLLPILMSLIEDNAKKTRLYGLRAIYLTIKIGLKLSCISDDDVIKIYPAVIKRLDDGCDDIRRGAVEALVFVWRALSKNYDLDFGKSHIDYLYTTAIVHLDDPEIEFQNLMLDAMMELAKIHPELLANKIIKCKNNFKNQTGLDKLLKHCHELLKNK
ncbi:dynein axonemal assembly factor 5 [Microplitis mediator]|uniref:dynein axonemal assembly factor 5 n=1 Tax=Microplitis mediator TaxID=375433 RepID=UPI002553B689|nr:dynein axonemal assembly factor 5 [Microplitis mediator]